MQNAIHNLEQYVTAGKAIFTVRNPATDVRFTYKVNKKENDNGTLVFFVSVLTGTCNESAYSYMGIINNTKRFMSTRNSRVTKDAVSFKAFAWLWANVSNTQVLDKVELRHEGRCGRCGRKLTTPVSIDQGFGPECIQHV